MTPQERITRLNDRDRNPEGEYILYWMIANRRLEWNFSLDRALELCQDMNKPLLILEALRCGYRWANDRIHQFIVDGMVDNAAMAADAPVFYYPYLEPGEGEGQGLLEALSARACAVVTDDFPCFFLPRMVKSAARQVKVAMEMVDSNGLYPMRLAPKTFLRAVDFRRHLQKELEPHFQHFPVPRPLLGLELPVCDPPQEILDRWPAAQPEDFRPENYPLDHSVPVVSYNGGPKHARASLLKFLQETLGIYDEDRNHPQRDGTSGFSPYLHFGHLSSHQVFSAIAGWNDWQPGKLSLRARGQREGWWGMSSNAEAFLDQIVTWRELGYNMCVREDNYDRWESLPQWARQTLMDHIEDEREYVYDLDQFEQARTHDDLWNAAQNQLRQDGHIHNYLRMLWAKKILHWSEHPEQALEIALHLNNKYCTDGRNPNSYSGVFWTFGRYDRPWGPERPIFGKIRYMTCASTRRKYKVDEYIKQYT